MTHDIIGDDANPGHSAPYRAPARDDRPAMRRHELHCCPACLGIWHDSGKQLKGLNPVEATEEPELAPQATTLAERLQDSMMCPRCDTPMDELETLYNPRIIHQICFDCGGIWFDGEQLRGLADPATAVIAILVKEHG
jgi:Zn-finger nucleic acid-binding protein